MPDTQLRELARLGAQARLQQLEEERKALLQMFSELRTRSNGRPPADGDTRKAASPTRKRRKMSAASRKAIGARMKAYWAARRADQNAHDTSTDAAGPRSTKRAGSRKK
jgi:hypothetical protein